MADIIKPGDSLFSAFTFKTTTPANLEIRSRLMDRIERIIDDRGLTQVQAAKLFHVKQPSISQIRAGKIDLITIDALVNMLANVGETVELRIAPTL